MRIKITCLSGAQKGQVYDFEQGVITFGRGLENKVRVDPSKEDGVSGRHCRILWDRGQALICDMRSTNGTLMNGHRVREAALLPDESRIRLGTDGPEFEIRLGAPDQLLPTRAESRPRRASSSHTVPILAPDHEPVAAAPGPVPRRLIGLQTLEQRLEVAERNLGHAHGVRTRKLGYALGATIAVVVALGLLFQVLDGKHRDTSNQSLRSLTAGVLALENSTTDLRDDLGASSTTVDARLASVHDRIARESAVLSEVGQQLDATRSEMKAVDQEIQGQLIEERERLEQLGSKMDRQASKTAAGLARAAAPFAAVASEAGRAIYAVLLRTRSPKSGAIEDHLIGTAFAIDSKRGLLGTNAHIASDQLVQVALRSSNARVIVRCSGSPRHTYNITRSFVHPDWKNGTGPDVGLLQADLFVDGSRLPFPGHLRAASTAALADMSPGSPLMLLGFPGVYADEYVRASGASTVAKISPGLLSAKTSAPARP